MTSFPIRGARSTALTVAVGAVLAVETAVLHLLLAPRHPLAAGTLTLASLATLAWLVADYVALGRSVVTLDVDVMHVSVGRRIDAVIPRQAIAGATAPTWRDLPDIADRSYLNSTKPAEPNVLIAFTDAMPIRLLGLVTRPIRTLGIRVDDPARLLAALGAEAPPHS